MLDDAAAARGEATLRANGFTDETLRVYTSAEMLAADEEFRAGRRLRDRLVGSLVDDNAAMTRYVDFGREGRSAVWVLTKDGDDANRVVRHLADDVLFIWYHHGGGVQTMQIR
jgi:hypothetical protein